MADASKAEVEALEPNSEPLMVEAKLMQNRRVKVVNVDGVLDHAEAELIRLAVTEASFESATGEPHREGVDVMITAG